MPPLEYERDGAAIFRSIANQGVLDALKEELAQIDFRAGARPLSLSQTVARLIAPHAEMTALARRIAGEAARPVRVLAFDKTPEVNWRLGWHQDRVIAVRKRLAAPGFGAWSIKNGIPHVEAPLFVLQAMFSLRLHLDACDRDNGALKVIPGSWKVGRLKELDVRQHAASNADAVCEAQAGDVVAMKALTIHASDASCRPDHRRVLHVDYSACELPYGLEWAMAS